MQEINLHEGIYKFYWPYLGSNLAPKDKEVDVNICNVTIYAGDYPVNQGTNFLVTIIIKGEKNHFPIQHCIEEICTKIRFSFFDKIFHEDYLDSQFLSEEYIRWIECMPLAYERNWNEVKMKWDKKLKHYISPEWNSIEIPKT